MALRALALVVSVVVVSGVWIAIDVLRVKHALTDARSQANDLTAQLKEVGPGGEPAIATQLHRDVAHARAITHDRPWTIGRHLPFVGSNFTALAQATDAVDGITTEGIPALTKLATERDNGTLSVSEGHVDLTTIRQLGPTLDRSDAAFTAGSRKFDAIKLSGTLSAVRSAMESVRTKLNQARSIVHTGAQAVALAPAMLGDNGPRNYLLVFQNNAEVRSTGGIPGAFAEVRADKGRVTITRQGAGADTGQFNPPALALTSEERSLYGNLPAIFWQDTNFSPDFPRTAQILRAMFKIRYHDDLAGVVSVDPIALAHVLDATGPVQVTPQVALSAANVVPVLLNAVYTYYPGEDVQQNTFFAHAASTIFAKVLSGSQKPGDLVSAIEAGINENRILVNLTAADEQALFAHSKVGGALPVGKSSRPQIGLYLNDSTQAKLEFYLRRTTSVVSTSCNGEGVQDFSTRTTLASLAPANVTTLGPSVVGYGTGATHGVMEMVLTYYAPYGGRVTSMSIDGVEHSVNRTTQQGLNVATVPITLAPGKKHVVTTTIESGPGERGDGNFKTTPGVVATPNNVRIKSTCG
ncbi:MAG TPA: DUF4012 domain-containing protein [Marmoricola sp.]|nr:DUF4012 domain-containing protein [Marmoricola sp.]